GAGAAGLEGAPRPPRPVGRRRVLPPGQLARLAVRLGEAVRLAQRLDFVHRVAGRPSRLGPAVGLLPEVGVQHLAAQPKAAPPPPGAGLLPLPGAAPAAALPHRLPAPE